MGCSPAVYKTLACVITVLLCYYDDLVPDDAPLSQVISETGLFSLSIRSSRHLKRLTAPPRPRHSTAGCKAIYCSVGTLDV